MRHRMINVLSVLRDVGIGFVFSFVIHRIIVWWVRKG